MYIFITQTHPRGSSILRMHPHPFGWGLEPGASRQPTLTYPAVQLDCMKLSSRGEEGQLRFPLLFSKVHYHLRVFLDVSSYSGGTSQLMWMLFQMVDISVCAHLLLGRPTLLRLCCSGVIRSSKVTSRIGSVSCAIATLKLPPSSPFIRPCPCASESSCSPRPPATIILATPILPMGWLSLPGC